MALEFYQGWAQDPNARPAVSGATSGNAYQVAYRVLVSGGQWTAISSYDPDGFKFPMTVTVPAYQGDFKAYQILISADKGLNWQLAYTGVNQSKTLQSYDSAWVISNPLRTIAPGLSLLDFGTFSSTISPSFTVFAKATSATAALKIGARRASGQTVPELFGKLYVEYMGKYISNVGSGLADAAGSSGVLYDHPYLSTNSVDLNLAPGEIAVLRLSLISYDPATPISTVDPVQLNLDGGATTYPLPLAPRQAQKGLVYGGLPTYTSSGLILTVKSFRLARYGAVIAVPAASIALPASSSTSVYVKADGSLTLSPTGFSVGKFATSGTAITGFTPELPWLPDQTRVIAASGAISFGNVISQGGAVSDGSSYGGVALGAATPGALLEYASEGVAWVTTGSSWNVGADVYAGASGQAVGSGSKRIGYALSAAISGFVLVQLDRVLTGGSGGGSTDLSVANRTSTSLDIASSNGVDATVPVATILLAGLMSAADKAGQVLSGANNVFTKTQVISAVASTVSGAVTLDGSASNMFDITASGTLNFVNLTGLVVGTPYTIILRLGSNAVTWGTGFKFATAPTLTGNCLLSFIATSSSTLWCAGYNQGY